MHEFSSIPTDKDLTPEQKFMAMEKLYWEARSFKEAGVRMLHPDWNDARVKKEVRDIFLYAGG